MEIRKVVGKNVRAFRHWRGLSQVELGQKSKLHRVYIGAIERGEQNVSLDNILKIADALDIQSHILLIEDAFRWIKK
jgi:transcriptional regulator with XRE-family HTH domain